MGELPQARLYGRHGCLALIGIEHASTQTHMQLINRIQSLCILALLGMAMQGCKSISPSLAFDQKILIKVPYAGEPAERFSTNGWRFKPLVAATPNVQQPDPAEWFLAWPPEDKRYQLRHDSSSWAWKQIRQLTPEIADVVHDAFGEYPMVIEPNLIFGADAIAPAVIQKTSGEKPPAQVQPPEVLAHSAPSKVWPVKKNSAGQLQPLWYLDDQFSQLRSARETVEASTPELNGAIRIGILDCGFDSSHVAMPEHIEDDLAANAVNILHDPDSKPIPPGATGTTHGTGTLGILAGRKVRLVSAAGGPQIEPIEDYLGGAPHATVVPVLVAPWVFSLQTADLAYGIDYASRVKQCDVISMSHGGAPSLIWADAVNSAYERGTAIFAATGDFYDWIGTDMGILVPSHTVYPAAFRSVMGVTGVTADGKTYAKNGIWNLALHVFSLSAWREYLFRGSYGADMETRWLFGFMNDPDPAQKWDNGILHPYPIAAYSPNIPWALSSTDPGSGGAKNLIDLDGAGTSAATPQVAAAGALWLQENYKQITSSNDWHSWKKAEAVYVALLASAARAKTNQPDHYLGAGILKAANALTNDYASICAMENTRSTRTQNEKSGRVPVLGFSQAPRDFYDGERSGAQLLFPWRRQPEFSQRADLRQSPKSFSTRAKALKNLYFNGFLLEQYEKARTPKKGTEESRLDAKAETLANNGKVN